MALAPAAPASTYPVQYCSPIPIVGGIPPWGYPGNRIKFNVRVTTSTDPACKVGTVGLVDEFGSYNGVRSDSVQSSFPKSSCSDHNHLYHGSQVNNQVPPA